MSDTVAPAVKFAVQFVGQLIPAGLLVTVPLPDIVTDSWTPVELKDAATDWLVANTSWHDAPLQAPLKPVNLKPTPAVAVRATEVPWAKLATQVEGQLIPAGVLTMAPVPLTLILNCTGCGAGAALELPPQPEPAIKLKKRSGTKCLAVPTSHVALTVGD